jgi:hypothetical protein
MTITQGPPTSRSPIKEPQLSLPGQSLDQESHDLKNEVGGAFVAVVAIAILLAGFEWVRWLTNLHPHPVIVTLVCLGFVCFAYHDLIKGRETIRRLKQGRDGERVVAQVLNVLALQGCHIFHDIPTGRGNLDHAIISRFGVFAIETKTPSKRGRDPQIRYDGQHLDIEGIGRHDEMVDQAEAQARWLRELLSNETGKQVTVQAVLAFPGWFVKGVKEPWEYRTWVTNPKRLLNMVPHGGEVVSEELVQEMAYRLTKHVRERLAG